MRAPIAYALSYPERISTPVATLDLAALGSLTFSAPDEERFPALRLAREVLAAGGSAPTVLNAANEIAVARFLRGAIAFTDIPVVAEKALASVQQKMPASIDDIVSLDAQARHFAEAACSILQSTCSTISGRLSWCCPSSFLSMSLAITLLPNGQG
jgi:1-deoxy-D-xylulose-5-phosphate reductoisomerase